MNKKKSIILILLGLFWVLFPLIIIFYKDLKIFIIFFCLTLILQCFYLLRYSSHIFKQMYITCKYKLYEQPIDIFYDNIFKNIPGIGDVLMFLCKIFSKLYKILGYYAIIISGVIFFILPNIILILLIFFRIFSVYKISAIAFILYILFIRIIRVIYSILCDFSLHNRHLLEQYLKITKIKERTYSYDFNEKKIANKTQETLNLYVSRYRLFEETYSYMQSTVDYKNKIIKPWLNPLMLSTLLTSNLKFVFMFFLQSFNIYLFIIIFILILVIEKYNIYKENKEQI